MTSLPGELGNTCALPSYPLSLDTCSPMSKGTFSMEKVDEKPVSTHLSKRHGAWNSLIGDCRG
jgi:hypothetical protein